MHFRVLVVEGIISAGKSTLINEVLVPELSKTMRVKVIREPVDEWVRLGLLQRFYADKKRWAYTFQTKAFRDRIVECQKALDSLIAEPVDLFIMERSPLSDQIFMRTLFRDGDVDQLEMDMYLEWCNLWKQLMPFELDLFLYVRTDLDHCMQRLVTRSRDGEAGIPKAYQAELLEEHERVFNPLGIGFEGSNHPIVDGRPGVQGVPCLVIDGTPDYRVDTQARKDLLSKLTERIG